MHELSLATNVIDYLVRLAKEQGLERIDEVFLEIGELTHVDPRQLRYCLKMASEGTAIRMGRFYIRRKRVALKCGRCGKQSQLKTQDLISDYSLKCPECGSVDITISKGRELVLKRVKGIKIDAKSGK